MALADKAYFGLEEVAERWSLSARDVSYLVENGLLRVSIRVWDVLTTDARNRIDGLVDLRPRDAHQLLRNRTGHLTSAVAVTGDTVEIIDPGNGLPVRVEDLVVRVEELDRAEGAVRSQQSGILPNAPSLRAAPDYRDVAINGHSFTLGDCQAAVVRILHDAARAGTPWKHGKVVLAQAGSSCTRMADLFKSQPRWRVLIASDRRGRYRLNIPLR